jgi:ABC-type antimicrobial peptide transport system permease subunit
VIGVVGDVQTMGLDVPLEPEFFTSANQSAFTNPFMWPSQLLVRTKVEPLALVAAVRDAVWAVDADQPVTHVRAMEDVLDAELANRNLQLTLIGSFAALALLLAAVGLYGVLAYTVTQRTREIGVRMALGALPRSVVGGVVRGAILLASLGIVLGLTAAFGLTRLLESFLYRVSVPDGVTPFLYGVSSTDGLTAGGVVAVLLVVTLLASYVPARRAAAVDPMAALRSD